LVFGELVVVIGSKMSAGNLIAGLAGIGAGLFSEIAFWKIGLAKQKPAVQTIRLITSQTITVVFFEGISITLNNLIKLRYHKKQRNKRSSLG
jgi:hypothetical protein